MDAIAERKALNVVVTGADHGLGLAVVRKLTAAGHRVGGISTTTDGASAVRAAGGLPLFGHETRSSEIASLVSMMKADVVVDLGRHAANQPLRSADWGIDTLAERAGAIAQAAKTGGAKFLVYVSSAIVYGDHDGHAVDEDGDNETEHPLLKALAAAEKAAAQAGIPACVLRMGYVYGAHVDALREVNLVLKAGRPLPSSDALANFVYDDDAAEAIRRVVEAQPFGEVFNVTDGHAVSQYGFLTALADEQTMGAPSRLPAFLNGIMAGSPLADVLKLSAQVKSDKIQAHLGWKPQFTSLKAGLADTFLSWRAAEIVV